MLICAFIITVVALVCLLPSFSSGISVYAYTDQNYIEAGINFLQKQYDLKEMSYDKIALKQTIALYDLDDNITAKIMVVDRDSELDYVILDFVADDIIAFGFNSKTYLQNF